MSGERGDSGRSPGSPDEEPKAGGADRGGIVVLGLGNSLLSDDGAGIHALCLLERTGELPPGVRLIDGGTVGPDLLPPVAGCDALLVLDAVDVGGQPGDVARLDLEGGAGRPGPRTIHEVGLETLLQDLALLGEFPRRAVLFGIQPASLSPGTGLSPPVERGLETLVGAALGELRRWTQTAGEGSGAGNAGGNARTEDER